MTNYEALMKKMSIDAMSKLLIKTEMVDDGDYDMDDNWQSFYTEQYQCPGSEYNSFSYKEDAEKECLEWLKKPYDKNEWKNISDLMCE